MARLKLLEYGETSEASCCPGSLFFETVTLNIEVAS